MHILVCICSNVRQSIQLSGLDSPPDRLIVLVWPCFVGQKTTGLHTIEHTVHCHLALARGWHSVGQASMGHGQEGLGGKGGKGKLGVGGMG